MKSASEKFLYFAFGSNLLESRVKINSPSAEFICYATLKNYELVFAGWSERWQGASATIIESQENDVIGCVYSIDKENLAELDRQEGVHQNIYEPLEISALGSDGKNYLCRTYYKKDVAEGRTKQDPPSKAYVSVIISGAKEHKFPEPYISQLETIEHNGIFDIPMLKNIEEGRKEDDEPDQ
ncbi:Oidioi.mRNA.OKI2018_I69.PAR.g12690.t1.cds [Oikopleura dioica]|uniref:gamma-glutamylcyclotransferase n=1 Tax=Oikopleura dioica TaxID=34765 RepID=A0ABN7S177_OIKDI|nr:Oidioi.mRNA.OKI2018_I69.PAR.g12690.t1.cds [Oikopleura dioica]